MLIQTDEYKKKKRLIGRQIGRQEDARTHIFSSDLVLAELDLDERTHVGEELPPGPVLHTPVLLDVLLDATDR